VLIFVDICILSVIIDISGKWETFANLFER